MSSPDSCAEGAREVGGRSVPAWYATALADEPGIGTVTVAGARISYRSWGEPRPGSPNLVLIHGAAAQGVWWDHIGPLLAAGRRVTALDLSGNGDSDRRPAYDLQVWAEEIMAVSEATAPASRPILIAHSMGGASALHAASVFAPRVAGVVLIDPLPHDVTSAETHARVTGKFGRQKVHPSRAAAVQRFRVVPEQATLDYVFAHIAEHSVREVDGGWMWKHDPAIYLLRQGAASDRRDIACPVALVHPEHGLSDKAGDSAFGAGLVARQRVVIPGAEHHIMMDEPLALVACLLTLLSGPPWSGSDAS